MPLIGRVKVAGLTIHDAEKQIAKQLEAFYFEPDVVLSVRVFRSQPVSVIGAVGTPGVHDVRGRRTLMEVLSQAGGLRADAGKTVKITRQNSQGALPIAGAQPSSGNTTVAEVSISSLVAADNPLENILVLPNDVITVPKASMVYVVGEVKHAGGFSLGGRDSMSALQALALAEGMSLQAAPSHARILRMQGTNLGDRGTADRKEIMVDLRRVMNGKNPDVFLQPEDILFVPNSTAKKLTTRALETALQVSTGILIFRR
jgi:polysaccharide export outer membrane protein